MVRKVGHLNPVMSQPWLSSLSKRHNISTRSKKELRGVDIQSGSGVGLNSEITPSTIVSSALVQRPSRPLDGNKVGEVVFDAETAGAAPTSKAYLAAGTDNS